MSNIVRRALKGGLVAFAGLCVLYIVHALRYTSSFNKGAQDLLARSAFVRIEAYPEYQDDVLATLDPNPHNGPYYRLDDLMAEAVVVEEPDLAASAEDSIVFSMEFDSTDTIGLRSALGRLDSRLSESLLWVRSDTTTADPFSADFLTNTQQILIPKDQVGSIVVRARTDQASSFSLSWSKTVDLTMQFENEIKIDLIPDGSFHTYEINAKNALKRGLRPGEAYEHCLSGPPIVRE